jgi:hypothetical protein
MEYRLSKTNIGNLSAKGFYNYSEKTHSNIFKRFLNWCDMQESNRFLWLGITFFAQIGLALPVAAFSIIFFGNNSQFLWITLLAVNLPTLVLNLAAFKTRITLPFLFFAWLTEALMILFCIMTFLA